MRVRAGCAGWGYDDWVGPFYAAGTPAGEFLPAYARAFDVVEVDSSYYRAPTRGQCARWAEITPDGFTFCPKVPQEVVRERRLRGAGPPFEAFLDALGPLRDAKKLGPVVLQMPPSFRREAHAADLDAFLAAAPAGTDVAVELRHPSWWDEGTYATLRAHRAALVWSWTQHGTTPPVLTADWTYARAVGDRELTRFDRVQRDVAPILGDAVGRLRAAGADLVRAFFIANNHVGGFAPDTVRAFQAAMGLPVSDLGRAGRAPGQRGLLEF